MHVCTSDGIGIPPCGGLTRAVSGRGEMIIHSFGSEKTLNNRKI